MNVSKIDREMTVQNTKPKDFVAFSDRGTIGVSFGLFTKHTISQSITNPFSWDKT